MSKKIGYIRVSTIEQNPERQLNGLDLDKCFTDKVSGKDTSRPQLNAMLDYVRDGDTVVVHSMDRLARNLDDLRKIVSTLTNQKINTEFIKEGLIFNGDDSPMSKLMLSVMGAFSEFERSLIKERQREGIELAKKRGVYKGRTPSLSIEKITQIKDRVSNGEKKASLAKEFGVRRETIHNYLKQLENLRVQHPQRTIFDEIQERALESKK